MNASEKDCYSQYPSLQDYIKKLGEFDTIIVGNTPLHCAMQVGCK